MSAIFNWVYKTVKENGGQKVSLGGIHCSDELAFSNTIESGLLIVFPPPIFKFLPS